MCCNTLIVSLFVANLCHLVLQADILRKLGQFVEVMFDHDDLLQSVCWTTSCMAFALDSKCTSFIQSTAIFNLSCLGKLKINAAFYLFV